MKKNLKYLQVKKDKNEKITMLACHDFPSAQWAEEAGVDIILVGESLGVYLLGNDRPEQLSPRDMQHHFKAVHRAVKHAYLIADLPLVSYNSAQQCLDDANRFMDLGADAIKVGTFDLTIVETLLNNYIDVCFDVIYPLVKAKFDPSTETETHALIEIIKIALALQKNGVAMFLLTLLPEQAAKAATELLSVPTIGIGSGPFTSGQMLVAAEMLGLCGAMGQRRYNKQYVDFERLGRTAMQAFVKETRHGGFPLTQNSVAFDEGKAQQFLRALENAIVVPDK